MEWVQKRDGLFEISLNYIITKKNWGKSVSLWLYCNWSFVGFKVKPGLWHQAMNTACLIFRGHWSLSQLLFSKGHPGQVPSQSQGHIWFEFITFFFFCLHFQGKVNEESPFAHYSKWWKKHKGEKRSVRSAVTLMFLDRHYHFQLTLLFVGLLSLQVEHSCICVDLFLCCW